MPVMAESTTMRSSGSSEPRCPYCGREYPLVTLPAFLNIPERTVRSTACGCEGEAKALRRAEHDAKVRTREERLRRIGIPKRFWDVPEDATHLGSIDTSTGSGLFIYGMTGRGKTTLAVATLKAWLNRTHRTDARFVDGIDFMQRMRSARSDGLSQRDVIHSLASPAILVFDDFGKGARGDWPLEAIEELVYQRHGERRPTIFTCQWSGNALVERLCEFGPEESATAIVGRINESCVPVHLDGPDLRVAKGGT